MLVQFSPEYKESHSFKSNLHHYFWVVDTVSKQVDSSSPNLLLYVAVDMSIPALFPRKIASICFLVSGWETSSGFLTG